jgi:thioredoxin reductase
MEVLHTKTDGPVAGEYDVVGGGASGLATALFTARYGIETFVFDRGQSAIRRSYAIENYPGFLAIEPAQFPRVGRAHAR